MDEEGRRRSERNRTRQTAAAGPPRLPATVATGTGSTSLGGSDDATTSQDGVAGQDSERSDTNTVGQRIPQAGPANVPPTIQTGLYGPTGDLSGLQTIVQEAVQAAVRGAVAGMTDLLRPATQHTHDPRPPAESDSLKLLLKNKRRTFREEKKKILQTKSGQPSDDIYIGKWKFYRAMLFLDASDANPGKRTCSENYGETIKEDCEGSAGGSDVPSPEHFGRAMLSTFPSGRKCRLFDEKKE
ncbi:hypothetical protein HPB47_005362 [Ixodes persulcatus]|uniref:Uncharacterized protein n=1 Tax=Ixodes persulcatus TaxID=34615 RepID=A0AC60PD76_IXOPE|nr:hypothetical protein HPB47_005362 [Ixodes persulcatus]